MIYPGSSIPLRFVNPDQTRTRETHPYSYDMFYHWDERLKVQRTDWQYSDRMCQSDPEKYRKAFEGLPNNMANWRRKECEQFLRVYYNKPYHCDALIEGCHLTNGFPFFVFCIREN